MEKVHWSDARILEASESNLYYPDSAVFCHDSKRLLVHMPADYGHSAVQRSYAASDSEARALIEEVLTDSIRARGHLPDQQLLWWVRPSTMPRNMAQLLEQRGFALVEEVEILGFELVSTSGVPFQPAGRRGVNLQTWRIVRTLDEMRFAHELRVRSMGSGGPELFDEAEAARDLRILQRLEEAHPVDGPESAPFIPREVEEVSIEFLAYEEMVPVATAGMSVRGAVGNFWGSATEEAYRGRGAYHLLIDARCQVARRLGATLALSKARRDTSAPLLKKAGFRWAGVQDCYALPLT